MSWRFELLCKPMGGVTEGPVWDGEQLLFTHIPASRIMRIDPKTDEITVWREGTNRTNGLAHDVRRPALRLLFRRTRHCPLRR